MENKTITVDTDTLKSVFSEQIGETTKPLEERLKALEAKDTIKEVDAKIEASSKSLESKITETIQAEMAKNINHNPIIRVNEKYENGLGQALHILGMSKVLNQSPEQSCKELAKFRPVHPLVQKNLSTLTEAAGGALMQEMYDSEILPLLYEQTVVRKAGPKIVPMPNGSWTRPSLSGGATAYWRGEGTAKTISAPTFATQRMDAKILTGTVVVSDQLLKYGHPMTSKAIQDDLISALAYKEDYTFLNGTGGTYEPMGLLKLIISTNQTTGVASETPASVYADLVKLFKYLADDKIQLVRPAIFMSTEQYYEIIGIRQSATGAPIGYAQTLSDNNTIFGVPVHKTSSLDSTIILVEMTHVLLGQAQAPTISFKQGGGYYNGSVYVTGDATGESVFTAELHEDFGMNYSTAGAALTSVDYGTMVYS